MKHNLLVVAALCLLSKHSLFAQAHVQVSAGNFINTWEVSPLGLNMNTLVDGDGNRVSGARPLREALQESGMHFLRFPGGEKSDVYQWAAAPYDDPTTSGLLRKGPSDWPSNDPGIWDLEADTWANDDYNFDEFMADCRATGSEPVISVALDGIYKPRSADGYTSLTREQALELAVAWVRYANVTRGYGIKYWLLGNETWNGVTYAGAEPAWRTYGRDVAEFAAAMKAVDPTILIGINGDNTSQLSNALGECAHIIDFIDVHAYPAYGFRTYADYLASPTDPTGIVRVAQRAIDNQPDAAVREKLFITMTEASATGFNKNQPWDTGNNYGQALANFDIFAQLAQDDRLLFAQYWNSRWIDRDRGISHAYDAFTATNELNASARVLSILSEELLEGMVATQSDNLVRTFATQSADEQLLTVFLLNKNTLPNTTQLTVNGVGPSATATRSVITGDGVTDVATSYRNEKSVSMTDNTVDLELPAASVTILRFDLGTTPTNSVPIALATATPTSGTSPLTVQLNGAGSTDADGTIVAYAWDWAGGSATGERTTATFTTGSYAVILTVTDDEGATDTDVVNITVTDPPAGNRSTFWLEAECGTVGNTWTVVRDPAASGEQYAVVQKGNAYTTAPDDIPANRIRFSIGNAEAGNYSLFARVRANSPDNDSFWVRVNGGTWYKWGNGFTRSAEFAWNAYSGPQISLGAGANTVDFAYREDGTQLDKLYLSKSGAVLTGVGGTATNCSSEADNDPPADNPSSFWLEAECGTVGSTWTVVRDAAASGEQYAVVQKGNAYTTAPDDIPANRIRFSIGDAGAGDYSLFARVRANSPDDDSFWVRVNDGTWYKWSNGFTRSTAFVWNAYPGPQISLAAGANTVDFAYREDGTQLDKLYLSKSATVPTGVGGTANSCGTESQYRYKNADAVAGSDTYPPLIGLESMDQDPVPYPNPTRASVKLSKRYVGGYYRIHALSGREVGRGTVGPDARVSFSGLPSGIYQLILGERTNFRVVKR